MTSPRLRPFAAVLGLVVVLGVSAARPASASFHLMQIE
jgi:hypothetical protein